MTALSYLYFVDVKPAGVEEEAAEHLRYENGDCERRKPGQKFIDGEVVAQSI